MQVKRWWPALAVLVTAVTLLLGPLGVRLVADHLSWFAPGYTLRFSSASGWLWAPQLGGVQLEGRGLSLRARGIQARIYPLALLHHQVLFDLAVQNAHLRLQLSGQGGAASSWEFLPRKLQVRGLTLQLDGRNLGVPDATITLNQLGPVAHGQHFLAALSTRQGKAHLGGELLWKAGRPSLQVSFTAQARIARYWWPQVLGGQIRGRYRLGGRGIQGHLLLQAVRLGFAGLGVSDLNGEVVQTASGRLTLSLHALAAGGPGRVHGWLDLTGPTYHLIGTASPQLADLIGQSWAQGKAQLRATLTGRGKPVLEASLSSSGEVSGIPVQVSALGLLRGQYLQIQGKARSGGTSLPSALQISLHGRLGSLAGRAQWRGRWAGQPLRAEATLGSRALRLQASFAEGSLTSSDRFANQSRLLEGSLGGALRLALPGVGELGAELSGSPLHPRALGTLRRLALPGLDLQQLAFRARADQRGAQLAAGPLQVVWPFSGPASWKLSGVPLTGGLQLSGAGQAQIDRVSGQLRLSGAGWPTFSGHLAANPTEQLASWTGGFGQLSLTKGSATLLLRPTAFVTPLGRVVSRARLALKAGRLSGMIRLSAAQGKIRVSLGPQASLAHPTAQLRGALGGQAVRGAVSWNRALLLSLASGSLHATLRSGSSLRLLLRGSGQQLRARWAPSTGVLDAQGSLDLSGLDPWLGQPLAGQLRASVHRGQGGISARLRDGPLRGQLSAQLSSAAASASLQAGWASSTLSLAGPLWPEIQLAGNLRSPAAQAQVALSGSGRALRLELSGHTRAFRADGFSAPRLPLEVSGELFPARSLSGSLGGTQLTLSGNQLRASGVPQVSWRGHALRGQLEATLGPGFSGQLQLQLTAPGAHLQLAGSWPSLRGKLQLLSPVRATASLQADLPAQSLALLGRAKLGGDRLSFQAAADSKGTRGRAVLSTPGGGRLSARLHRNLHWRATLTGVAVPGGTLSGQALGVGPRWQLQAGGNLLGKPLALSGSGNGLTGGLSLQRGRLSARATLRSGALELRARSPWATAHLAGPIGSALRGSLSLAAQSWELGGTPAGWSAQRWPLQLDLPSSNLRIGQLTWRSGQWNGQFPLNYQIGGSRGQLSAQGEGGRLAVSASGPLAGRVTLGAQLSGQLRWQAGGVLARLAQGQPWLGRLHPSLGALRLSLSGSPTAPHYQLASRGLRWLGGPLQLRAAGSLAQAFGKIRGPGLEASFAVGTKGLKVFQASLAAGPLFSALGQNGVSGDLQGNLSWPNFQMRQAEGKLSAVLLKDQSSLLAALRLQGGAVSGSLQGRALGIALSAKGKVGSAVQASFHLQAAQGELAGKVSGSPGNLRLQAGGVISHQPIRGVLSWGRAGLGLQLQAGKSSLGGSFTRSGSGRLGLQVRLPRQLGVLRGAFRSTSWTAASGELSGQLGALQLRLPLTWAAGQLSLAGGGRLSWPGRFALQAAGTAFPRLDLFGQVHSKNPLVGQGRVSATGSWADPQLSLQGELSPPGSPRALPVQASWSAGKLRLQLGTVLTASAKLLPQSLGTPVLESLAAHGQLSAWGLKLAAEHFSYSKGAWSGRLSLRGSLAGYPLRLRADGQGVARLRGAALGEQLRGELGRRQAGGPALQLELAGGTLPLLPEVPLRTAASLDLGGTWLQPTLALAGETQTPQGPERVTAQGGLGGVQGRIEGKAATGTFRVSAASYQFQVQLHGARFSPSWFPKRWLGGRLGAIEQPELSGVLSGRGHLPAGLGQLRLSGLEASARVAGLGEVQAFGGGTFRTAQLTLYGAGARAQLSWKNRLLQLAVAAPSLRRWLGPQLSGPLQGDLQLSQAGDLSGQLQWNTPVQSSSISIGGSLSQPRVTWEAQLTGKLQGALRAQLSHFDLAKRRADLRLSGEIREGSVRAEAALSGRWPELSGSLRAQLPGIPPVHLTASDGQYLVQAGRLGQGRFRLQPQIGAWPELSGKLQLAPLAWWLPSVQGSFPLAASLGGTLDRPRLLLRGQSRELRWNGIRLPSTSLTGSATERGWALALQQAGHQVAHATPQGLVVQGLALQQGGTTALLSGKADLQRASLRAQAQGLIRGQLQAAWVWADGQGTASLQLASRGLQLQLQASARAGKLQGSGQLSGLPDPLPPRLALALQGAPVHPALTLQGRGQQGVLWSARASLHRAALSLRGGTGGLKTSGTLRYRGGSWGGQLQASGLPGKLRAALSLRGTLWSPQAQLQLSQTNPQGLRLQAEGNWRAAQGSFFQGDAGIGEVTWNGRSLRAGIHGLRLGKLPGIPLHGKLSLQAQGAPNQLRADLQVQQFSTAVPYLAGVMLTGSLRGSADLRGGSFGITAAYRGPDGGGQLSVQHHKSWSGTANMALVVGGVSLAGQLDLQGGELNGLVSARGIPLQQGALRSTLSGLLRIRRNQLSGTAQGLLDGGSLQLSGTASLRKLLPATAAVLADTPQAPTDLQASLQGFDLADLHLNPYLQGKLDGSASWSGGPIQFRARTRGLRLAGRKLPLQLTGQGHAGAWKLRVMTGFSTIQAQLGTQRLSVHANLVNAPVGDAFGLFSGPLPGRADMSGVVSYRAQLAHPLAGSLRMVADTLRISGGGETLTGEAAASYRGGLLDIRLLKLGGDGSLSATGTYSPAGADLKFRFDKTSFTPFLSLVPRLRGLNPRLRGSLQLTLRGQPSDLTAQLDASQLQGQAAGIHFSARKLLGQLSGNSFRASGTATVGSWLQAVPLVTSGTIRDQQVGQVQVDLRGPLQVPDLGALQGARASLVRSGGKWTGELVAQQGGGTLQISGELQPKIALNFQAERIQPDLRWLLSSRGQLSAAGSIRQRGNQEVVRGAVTLQSLSLGGAKAVSQPSSSKQPQAASQRARPAFVSPLPPRDQTFQASRSAPAHAPVLQRIVFDRVSITATRGVTFRQSLAQAELAGNLTLNGTAYNPLLSGTIQVLRGQVYLRQHSYQITSGAATFNGSGYYPQIALTAVGNARDGNLPLRVTLQVSGEFSPDQKGAEQLQLQTQLSSSPSEPENVLYSLVVLGTNTQSQLPGEVTQSAVNTALNVFVLGAFEQEVAKALGIDVFRLNTNLLSSIAGTSSSTLSAQFTLGTYLTQQFYLQYQVDLSGSGLLDAQYTTANGKVTFSVSSPIEGLNLGTLSPSLSVSYNFTPTSSLQFGLSSGPSGSFSLGYQLDF